MMSDGEGGQASCNAIHRLRAPAPWLTYFRVCPPAPISLCLSFALSPSSPPALPLVLCDLRLQGRENKSANVVEQVPGRVRLNSSPREGTDFSQPHANHYSHPCRNAKKPNSRALGGRAGNRMMWLPSFLSSILLSLHQLGFAAAGRGRCPPSRMSGKTEGFAQYAQHCRARLGQREREGRSGGMSEERWLKLF